MGVFQCCFRLLLLIWVCHSSSVSSNSLFIFFFSLSLFSISVSLSPQKTFTASLSFLPSLFRFLCYLPLHLHMTHFYTFAFFPLSPFKHSLIHLNKKGGTWGERLLVVPTFSLKPLSLSFSFFFFLQGQLQL